MSLKKVHATAIVEDGVELGHDVEVGPYTIIRAGAKIGDGVRIDAHANIWGQSTIDREVQIFPYCIIGAPPQILGDDNPEGRAVIGARTILREGVQVHRGSKRETGKTVIGSDCYIMSSVHVAHDCQVGNHVIIATHTGLAGHVKIFDHALLSGACGLAQYVRVGSYTYCAGMTRFEKDLPPFMCAKEFSAVTGPNLVGLKRAGFTPEDIRVVKEIFKGLYIEKGLYREQLEKLKAQFAGQKVFEQFYEFTQGSKLGLMRGSG